MNATHHIISMKRGETASSKSPMWRCQTTEGDWVNVFLHKDPKKDNGLLFQNAGWWPEMVAMQLDEIIRWSRCPVPVVCQRTQDGKFWNIVAVIDRPEGAVPDVMYKPDLAWYKQKARRWASNIGTIPSLLYFDTETTGTDAGAEIISIAILDYNGETMLNSLIKPLNMEAVDATTDVHGLTPAQLEHAPTFPSLYREIERMMDDRLWCAYNADFDVQMIDQSCMIHRLPAIINRGVHDALTNYSQYAGLWLPESERWQKIKLAEAAQACGIVVEESHDALADTQTLFKLVEHMAGEAGNV